MICAALAIFIVALAGVVLWLRPWVDDAKKDNDLIGD